MESYKKFVRQNREFVRSLESMANGLTWLLPERFSNSEIGPEAVYALLSVVSTVNQHIIDTIPVQGRSKVSLQSSSPWPLCISVLKDLETVVEVAAQHFLGDDRKWNFIALSEATKVLVRLAQFKDSGYNILLQGGETSNIDKASNFLDTGPGRTGNYSYDPRNLEERAMSALNMFAHNAKMNSQYSRIGRSSNSTSDNSPKKGLFIAGEVLYIIRPLVYVMLIRRYGIRSWTPWFISLVLDLTGVSVLSYATRPLFSLSTSEQNEMKRRKVLWALYIMRDPFFSNYVRRRLESGEKYLHQVPVVGFLTAKIVELLIGAQTRYTYTSGS